jgi:hypothetical protein
MNRDKRGRPYSYSDALMLIMLAVREYFGLPYRQTEGFAMMLGGIWGNKDTVIYPDLPQTEGAQCAPRCKV